MTSIDQAFFDAVLADIVYVDGITPGMRGNEFRDKIQFRVPLSLAQQIGDRFQVIAVRDDPASEFQGAVFKDLTDGTVYIANRGTAGGKDTFVADIDLALFSGVARDQVATMVNWWNDIANPAGTPYTKVVGVSGVPLTFGPDGSATSSGSIAGEVAQASAAGKLRVVGHSLGGHLGTILASLFHDQISHSSTFNGAGLFSMGAVSVVLQSLVMGTPLSQIASIIGRTPRLPNTQMQDNFYAANGLSVTTNDLTFVQLGQRIPVYNEKSPTLIPNHFMYKQTDSLALFRAIEQLDPKVKLSSLNALTEAASTQQSASLELLLDGLRGMLLGPGLPATPVSDDGGDWEARRMPPERTAYHDNLKALVDAPAFQSLVGKVDFASLAARSGDGLAVDGKTDFGTFAALRALSPFAFKPKALATGSQAALDNLWQSTGGTEYLQWQTDEVARLNGGSTTDLEFTDPWYADRGAMLAWKNRYNRDDGLRLRSDRTEAYVFEDLAPDTAISLVVGGRQPASLLNPVKITFGSDLGDTLTGGDALAGDHLYGLGGADTIGGNGGNDYLEGNADADTLNGNDGNDTLLGGKGQDQLYGDANDDRLYGGQGADLVEGGDGRDQLYGGTETDTLRGGDGVDTLDGGVANDLLTGGADNDTLQGGAGNDSYLLTAGDGNDTIDDSDGSGEIRIGADRLDGGDPVGPGLWSRVFNGKQVLYAFTPGTDGRGDLLISSLAGNTTVKHFMPGDLGIVLSNEDPALDPNPSTTGNILGTALDDNRLSTGGRHPVLGGGANERVQGLAARDEVSGATGNDIAEGGQGIDIVAGNDGNDAVFADVELTETALRAYITSSATSNTAGSMPAQLQITQSEWAQGGMGDDTVVGVDGNDILFGGGGKDLMIGGAGHDLINGDDDYDPGNITNVYVQTAVGPGAPFDAFYSSVNVIRFAQDVGDADEVHAGSGDDFVFSQLGADTVWGDDGNDTLAGGEADDVVFGGRGNDRIAGDTFGQLVGDSPSVPSGADFIDGGEGDDDLSGDGDADTIIGGIGDDSLRGNNALVGPDHFSTTSADDGDDYLSGGDGIDNLVGDAGDDTLLGGDGNDQLFGDSDQTAVEFHGDDYLDGGKGDDYLRGYEGDDTLLGGLGRDSILGEAGDDYLDGGDLTPLVSNQYSDVLSGGDDDDVLINAYYMLGDAGDDVLSNGHDQWGGDGNDRMSGGVLMFGGNGDDTMAGSRLYGEAGADTLNGGAGDDRLSGGTEDDVLDGGDGGDLEWGDEGDDLVFGGASNDQIQGGSGHDLLSGDDGDDVVLGQDGDDRLDGGSGRDFLLGGAGNDTYVIDGTGDQDVIVDDEGTNTVEFGDGITADLLTFRQASDPSGNNRYVDIQVAGTAGHLVIAGGMDGAIAQFRFADGKSLSATEVATLAGAATGRPPKQVAITGGFSGGVLHGTATNDSLRLPTLDGSLWGLDGNDTLTGGSGSNTLYGGNGSDRLDGGGGTDNLDGGLGTDTFAFGRSSGNVTIVDQHFIGSTPSEIDTVELAPGILPANVRLVRDNSDLVVMLDSGAVQARIEAHFSGVLLGFNATKGKYELMPADTSIERVRFADGTVLDASQIAARIESGSVNAMTGTSGDNTFTVDNGLDTVAELPNGGSDTIQSSVSYALRPNVEKLVLTGQLNSNAWANASNTVNYLVGNNGNNTFDGPGSPFDANGVQYDTSGGGTNAFAIMSGGKGDDTYYYDYFNGGQAVENPNEGTDTIYLTHGAGAFTLPANIENVRDLIGGAGRFTEGADTIMGNSLDNFLGFVGGMAHIPYYIDGGAGADTMQGAEKPDVYIVDHPGDRVVERLTAGSEGDEIRSSVTYELPDAVEVLTLTGSNAIDGWGNELDNRIDGTQNASINQLHGGLGSDYYIVHGNDEVAEKADEGIDTVEFHGTGTRLYTSADLPANVESLALGDDLGASDLQGDAGDNVLTGNASDNRLEGRAGDDRLFGGGGVDTYTLSKGFGHDWIGDWSAGNQVVFDATIAVDDVYFDGGQLWLMSSGDSLVFSNADIHFADGTTMTWAQTAPLLAASFSHTPSVNADLLNGTSGSDQFDGLAGDDYIYGFEGNDTLNGGADNDLVNGGAGSDVLNGNVGNDTLLGGADNDTINGDAGADTLSGNDGDDTLDGGTDNDTLHGDAGNDTLEGGADRDFLYGGDGDDILRAGDEASTYITNILDGGSGDDTLVGGGGSDSLTGGLGNDTMDGGAGDDTLFDTDGDNTLRGGDGDDNLAAEAGNDILDGGAGTDSLQGGAGIDSYALTTGGGIDTVVENWYSGENTVILVDAALRPADIAIARVDDADGAYVVISANAGADALRLQYLYAAPPVEVRFGDGTVWNPAAVCDKLYVRRGTAGNDTLVAGSGDTQLFGYAGNDTLVGGAWNDLLDGGIGADAMSGGAGNDTYVVDDAGDAIAEAANEGQDVARSSITYVLPINVEELLLTSIAAFNATGNALDNKLTGNGNNNVLDGKAGRDTMAGGAGNDTYVVDNLSDIVTELANEGADTVQSSVTFTLATDLEHLTLTGASAINGTGNAFGNAIAGNSGANTLTGGSGNDQINGGAGADTMKGGLGDDTYTVDNTSDVVTELASEGTDLVLASTTFTLGSNVENLTLTGASAINGTGNTGNNILIGNSGNNVLNGGTGADAMSGGLGSDTYVIDNAGDVVTESANEGADLVQSALTYTAGANVENLTLTGAAAINATGNALANTLIGNTGNNILDGSVGTDTLKGGAGNDTYIVDVATDVVTELAGEGTDLVQSAVTLTLAANVENLTLTGTAAINATGNASANTLSGNTGNNVLDGLAGADTMKGGIGNDTYVVDIATDVVTENAGEGTDLVQSAVTLTLATNVENLTLTGATAINGTGNGLVNTLTGNAANNTLDGGTGADTLVGGAGNDSYVVDNVGDLITEGVTAGTDAVNASVTYVLAANVEYLTLTGAGTIDGTGNALDNWLRGNIGVNNLTGMDGNDTLWGDAGNDTLNGNNGNDLLQGGVGNDVLTDTVGNNLLDGGAGTDTLVGGAAREMLIGGTGNDTLTAGGGADVIGFNKGDGADTVNASVGSDDTLTLGGGLAYADLKLKKSGLDLILDASNGDQITFKNWYQTGVNNKSVLNLQVVADAMAAFNPAGSDPLLNKKLVNFNFSGIVGAFDTALAANPTITSWNLTNALSGNYLAGSDTSAIGGDFAYDFGHRNALMNIGAVPAQSVLAGANFATAGQTLQAAGTLYAGTVRLS